MTAWRRGRQALMGVLLTALAACGGDGVDEHPLSPITIHTAEWAGDTNRDMSGFYWETLIAVFEPVGVRIVPTWTDYTESIADVQAARCDMALSTYAHEHAEVIYPNWPQEVDQPVAVQLTETPIRGLNSLNGARLGWIRGYAFEQFLPADVQFRELESVESGLDLLWAGELDVLIDYRPGVEQVLAETSRNPETVAIQPVPHLARAVFPMFRNDERGRALAALYDERMAELFANGTLHAIHARHGRGAPLIPRQM